MSDLSRREFVGRAVVAAAVTQVGGAIFNEDAAMAQATSAPAGDAVELRWLEGLPASCAGTTWGVPWPMGTFKKDQTFALKTDKGDDLPMQTWPIGYWPDGSLKWTAHVIGPGAAPPAMLKLSPGATSTPKQSISVKQVGDAVEVDTGVIRCVMDGHGSLLLASIHRDGKPILKDARLVLLLQDRAIDSGESGVVTTEQLVSDIDKVTVEQSGPLRAVVRIEGKHQSAPGRTKLPFIVRLYFHGGGDAIRIMHTFVFDGDESSDFVRGIGVRFSVPMLDDPHNRHVRFVGQDNGLWGEAVRNLTGLRRDAGSPVKSAQVAGIETPPLNNFPRRCARG